MTSIISTLTSFNSEI